MSQAPRPYSTPSRTSPPNGSLRQFAAPDRHHVGMAGEADVRPAGAQAGEHVLDLTEAQPMDGEAQAFQRIRQHVLRAAVSGRHRGASDQRLRQRQRIGSAPAQSRNNSLMEVFARVCASTVLTMTAQYSDGPGDPSGSGLPGNEPGTTTE